MTLRRGATPESQLLAAVLQLLAAERILAFRMNTGAANYGTRESPRYVRFGVPGMADVQAFPYGRVAWLELKSATGRQRPEQKSFQQQVEEYGQMYLVIRSIDEVIGWLADMKRKEALCKRS